MISSSNGIIWTTTLTAHSMQPMRRCLYSWRGDARHRWANILSDVYLKSSACRMWTDFVKFGNPSPPGVEWTPVSEDFRGWLEIGPTGQLEMASSDSTFEARMEFWDSLFPSATMPWLSFIQNRQVTLHSEIYLAKGAGQSILMGRADPADNFRQGGDRDTIQAGSLSCIIC